MHYLGVEGHAAIFAHKGQTHTVPVKEFAHPEMPGGGTNSLILISPPVTTDEGEYILAVPLTGDARAQHLHAVKHRGEKARAALRARVEDDGGVWHLDDDGNPPDYRLRLPPPGVPAQESDSLRKSYAE